MSHRENALKSWIQQSMPAGDWQLEPLAGDASFRRYYRLLGPNAPAVVMDAPPPQEDVRPFIKVQQALQTAGLAVPAIRAQAIDQGWLVLDDLGDQLLLGILNADNASHWYHQALNAIVQMQGIRGDFPLFDQAFMRKEMSLCPEWFFGRYLQMPLSADQQATLDQSMDWLAAEISCQPQVFIHRDYHSRNLMVHQGRLAMIDFQDAMLGPVMYDAVSLLKDCYITWPRAQVLAWLEYFRANNPLLQQWTAAEAVRAFDLCGLQRHLKVLGIFARLWLRDGKSGYLKDLPLTLRYSLECAEIYPELQPLFGLLSQVRLP